MYKFINKLNRRDKEKKGFTLVETLVALSIFSVSILGLISILGSSLSNTSYAKKKDIAAYLAQEGIEYMRNMRDTYVLYDPGGGPNGWTNFNDPLFNVSGSACNGPNGCYLKDLTSGDYTNNNQPMTGRTLTCGLAVCPALKFDSSTGKYNYGATSGTNIVTDYVRTIKTTVITSDETQVFSTVSWKQGSGTYSMTFSENLFNWVE